MLHRPVEPARLYRQYESRSLIQPAIEACANYDNEAERLQKRNHYLMRLLVDNRFMSATRKETDCHQE